MERVLFVVLSAWMFWSPAAFAKPSSVVDGEWEYVFDEKDISKPDLRSVLDFSDHGLFESKLIESCPVVTIRKAAMSGGGWAAWATWGPSWLATARTHVQQGTGRVDEARSIKVPAELESARSHVVKGAVLHLGIDGAIADLLETNDAASLRRPIGDIDPGAQCGDAIAKAVAQPTREGKLKVARVDWNNCLIGHQGSYPTAAWRSFLKRHRITEKRRKDWSE